MLSDAKRIVIKVGTTTLTYENGKLNIGLIEKLVRVLSDIKNSGKDVILVSSGAIAVGVSKLRLTERPKDLPGKQAAAAVGQCALMHLYDTLFSEYGYHVSQVLLTRDSVEQKRKDYIVNTFEKLLSLGSIPIVNENDTVSVEEIEFGDNDALSAIVAEITQADLLIILSDIDGLYDKDPKTNAGAQLIHEVNEIDGSMWQGAGPSRSTHGTGGMTTKLAAAKAMLENGKIAAIINGNNPKNILAVLNNKPCGTVFIKK